METWKDIPTFEGRYQISTFGRVRNKKTSYILKSNSKGTPCVSFVINNHTVHTLVAKAFIQNPNNFKQINHIDGNKQNNVPSNLEWCSSEYNIHHAIKTGLRKSPAKGVFRHPVSVKCCKDGKIFSSMQECAEFYDISYSYLAERVRLGKSVHGIMFERLN